MGITTPYYDPIQGLRRLLRLRAKHEDRMNPAGGWLLWRCIQTYVGDATEQGRFDEAWDVLQEEGPAPWLRR